ncbi:MAG: hypothetical protein MJZ68_04995 [archaeon]|nr:hypothetical protein [archaeon]
MSIKVPDDFEDYNENTIEFLDGGDDTNREIMASVFSTIADTVTNLNMIVLPSKLFCDGSPKPLVDSTPVKPLVVDRPFEMEPLHKK